jgi:hypothetical protein
MADDFDLFCFEHCDSMLDILGDGQVSTTDAGGQLVPDYPDPPATSCDLGVLSGEAGNGSFPDDTAVVSIEPEDGVPNQFTTEWIVTFESLPENFADLDGHHVYFGTSDASGPCVGLFFSEIGIAYTGSVHVNAGTLVVDSPDDPTVIPGSADRIELDTPTLIRLAVDGDAGVAYLYVTTVAQAELTGQTLVAVFPCAYFGQMGFPPIDQSLVTVKGTEDQPSRVAFDKWCLASAVLVPNLPPIASAGTDQAVRLCSIIQLDGTASFDPEGAPLSYSWRLIGSPPSSAFTVVGDDGITYPLVSPTGFTDLFHSDSLGDAHAVDPLQAGDVLVVAGVVYDVVATGSDGNGFYVQVEDEIIPDAFSSVSFRVFRMRGLSVSTPADPAQPTFLPDVLGFYRFELVVSDGLLDSQPSVVVVNVVDSPLPRGIIPDAKFVFDYLSDYWNLLEDREPVATLWSGMMQVTASELYTLWQHDYGKSLRDIQRTFVRRWLHYDLLLAEPLPELTTIKAVTGGVRTNRFDSNGASLNGNSFTLTSPEHDETTITIAAADPVTPEVLAAEVQNRLLELDARYTTALVTRKGSLSNTAALRINAPFAFTISDVTGSVFVAGSNGTLTGTGTAIASRTYQIQNDGLNGVELDAGDFIVIDDEVFRIQQVLRIGIPEDVGDYTDQNIIVTRDLPLGTTSWSLPSQVTSELLDFYAGLVTDHDRVYFDVSAEDEPLEAMVLGASEEDSSRLGFGLTPELLSAIADSESSVRLARVLRARYAPIHADVVDIPTLVELIEIRDDEATLRRNLDFFIEDFRGQHCLRFAYRPYTETAIGEELIIEEAFDPWELAAPPPRLWAEYTYFDNRSTIEDNFGLLAGVSVDQVESLPGNIDYLSAVRGLWYAYVNGPTLHNLRVGAQILLGLPFAEEAGTIEEIRTDFSPSTGRILIRDGERNEIVRSYTFPRTLALETNPATGALYAEGDTVQQFAPLVKGVEVVDYVSDPTWFQGLVQQGLFYEVEKFFKFLVRVDAAAFGLESMGFVSDFMLKIKPTYTYPLFLVSQTVEDTEISITDELDVTAQLVLLDVLCDLSPFSTSLDDARAGGGGYWNQLDTDSNDATPLPTFDTSDTVEWALDRYVFCPIDFVTSGAAQLFAGPGSVAASNGLNFVDGEDLYDLARFRESGPFSITNGATGESITAEAGATVPLDGTIDYLRILIAGGPGDDPTGYELVVAVDGVDEIVQAFTATALLTQGVFSASEAVTAGQAISVRIRHASGVARTPDWTHVRVEVGVNLGPWTDSDMLPVGNYWFTRELTP